MTIVPIIPVPLIIIIAAVLLILSPRNLPGIIKRVIAVILFCVISVRIMVPTDEVDVVKNDVDVLFVVDNTISMVAEDYGKGRRRIDAVKDDVNTIIDEFEGSRFALVTFSNDPFCLVPYTTDVTVIKNAVESLDGLTEYTGSGTSMRSALEGMETMLRHNMEALDEEDADLDIENGNYRVQVVFLITDGEMNIGRNLPEFDEASDYIDTGAVLGYGTERGGIMRVYYYSSYYDDEKHVLYYTNPQTGNYERAVSKIDEENLESMASGLGVDYYHLESSSDTKDMIDDVLKNVEKGDFDHEKKSMKGRTDIYWIAAAGLAVLLLIDFIDLRRKLGQTE